MGAKSAKWVGMQLFRCCIALLIMGSGVAWSDEPVPTFNDAQVSPVGHDDLQVRTFTVMGEWWVDLASTRGTPQYDGNKLLPENSGSWWPRVWSGFCDAVPEGAGWIYCTHLTTGAVYKDGVLFSYQFQFHAWDETEAGVLRSTQVFITPAYTMVQPAGD